jgi:hypothetical protein
MVSVKVEDAENFYEEDEDPQEIFAAFEAADKGLTAPPRQQVPTSWFGKVRSEIAIGLRRLAKLIEPSPRLH